MRNTVAHQLDGVAKMEWLAEKLQTGETIIKDGVRRRVESVEYSFDAGCYLVTTTEEISDAAKNTAKGNQPGRHAKEGSRLS